MGALEANSIGGNEGLKGASVELRVAYLAEGKLFLYRPGEKPALVESHYAQEMADAAARAREKNEWKTRSETGRIMSGQLFGGEEDPTARRFQISGITRGPEPETLIYALSGQTVGGLFLYNVPEDAEQRLFHRNGFLARHLARHPEQKTVAASLYAEDGGTSIALTDFDGRGLRYVTEGDSVDECPAWVPGDGLRLVFQSAGIGRDQNGHMAGLGPYAVQLLDVEDGELTTLVEDPKTDYLSPRMLEDGTLYYIRRPYLPGGPRPSPVLILKDIVLLPLRLLWAIFGFLNFFSMMFSGKPLLTAGGPKREGPNPRYLMLWGKMVDAERAERAARKGEPVSLVPKDWALVRRSADGREEVLAESVLSFDLHPDGGVVYTNGSAIYRRAPDGRPEPLCEGRLIEHVMLAG